ncbi:MAG: hypothetical protein OHK93_001537 [Ramalina farinacea]|uniref:Uncharacterized protein n=1 Tax=Ramalina farinacea TaxID=258253 RepID=A0AA43TZL0_9LECA|nr:hypothetical protein [Ramalina farinacea]
MDDVIENCHNTFEEDGVSQQTLEDLKTTWQTKLSALKVGSFPWEPTPAPQPMQNPTVPSNVPRPPPASVPSSSGAAAGSTPYPSNPNGPRIKTEPGLEQPIPSLPPNYGNNDAKDRAIALMQEKYGSNATPQISKLQSQMLPNSPSAGNASRPLITPEQQRAQQAEYQRREQALAYHRAQQQRQQQHQHQQQQQQQQQGQQHPVAGNGQTDGADDWDGYVNQRRLEATEARQRADMTIREQADQMSRAREGGGLMMPVSEQPKAPKRKLEPTAESRAEASKMPRLPQLDGVDDDEEDSKAKIKDELFGDEDEDAINSDLDDPDDNEIEEENDDGKPTQVILCTYDKVQRVKTKWKCTLRDGVLNSGGKEYVFSKANGEFEW